MPTMVSKNVQNRLSCHVIKDSYISKRKKISAVVWPTMFAHCWIITFTLSKINQWRSKVLGGPCAEPRWWAPWTTNPQKKNTTCLWYLYIAYKANYISIILFIDHSLFSVYKTASIATITNNAIWYNAVKNSLNIKYNQYHSTVPSAMTARIWVV